MTDPTAPSAETPVFVTRWLETLPTLDLAEIAPDPARAAIFSADLINGFVHEGPLASPRVNALTGPVVRLLHRAWDHGVRDFVFLQDTHPEDTPEFRAYPPHAVAGTSESEMIPELASLPFASDFTVIRKNSLHPAVETGFDAWWDRHREVQTAIVIGDCTDLCINHLSMHLRLRANALGLHEFEVIIPADCVDTFHIPDSDDLDPGMAHPGDFFHDVFLYHLASNGIRVVRSIT